MKKLIRLLKILLVLLVLFLGYLFINYTGMVHRNGVCTKQRSALIKHWSGLSRNDLVKHFMPQCDFHGEFYAQQCNPSLNACWCVDREGHSIAGTKTEDLKHEPKRCRMNWFSRVYALWQTRARPF